MKIGIILGFILGIILLLISGISFLIAKNRNQKCNWCLWVALGGICALVTAVVNLICFFY